MLFSYGDIQIDHKYYKNNGIFEVLHFIFQIL